MASITRGSIRNNVHGNFRCINKKPPVPKKLMAVQPHPVVVAPVENLPTPVVEAPKVEAAVEIPVDEKSDIGNWKARREKKKKSTE